MTNACGDHGPHGKRMVSLFPAHHGFLNGDQFVNVEEEPGEMTEKKYEDESHAYSRQVIFKKPPALVAMLNGT